MRPVLSGMYCNGKVGVTCDRIADYCIENEEVTEQWKKAELSIIKKCRQLGAARVLEDESGFSLVSLLK